MIKKNKTISLFGLDEMILYQLSQICAAKHLVLPARTAVPMQESNPDRNELNGNDPTNAM